VTNRSVDFFLRGAVERSCEPARTRILALSIGAYHGDKKQRAARVTFTISTASNRWKRNGFECGPHDLAPGSSDFSTAQLSTDTR
jgi:hypothetical protein